MKVTYVDYSACYKKELSYMIKELYIEDPEGESMSQEKIDATIKQACEHPDRLRILMIVGEDRPDTISGDEIVVGYAIIQLIWSNEWGGLTANIDEMYVTQSARSQGAATKFIKELPELLPEINRLTLEVTPSNDKALKLYERLGFRVAENRNMEKAVE